MALASSVFGVCLALAATPSTTGFFPVHEFTLAWTHSIEKTRWEEDYRVIKLNTPGDVPKLLAGKARVRGSAAGMDPPADAVLHKGWYEYQPSGQLPAQLRLTRSGYTADYEWCVQGACQPMQDIFPTDGGITLLYACSQPK